MSKIAIEYYCYLNQSGYSQAAQDVVRALEESNLFDVRTVCIHKNIVKQAFCKESYSFFYNLCSKPFNPRAIQVFHCIPEKQSRFKKLGRSISFATFETFQPPQSWINHLNQMDAVICPSNFNYNIFAHAGVKRPLYYIPHAIDGRKWNNLIKPSKKYDVFTFLFVGTWRIRKGWKQLMHAWIEEFSDKDNVQLLIHTDKAEKARKDITNIEKEIKNKSHAKILVEDNVISDDNLPAFMKSSDCLISTSLGEGFGLPPAQAMALNIPVIVVNFGGCKDYANKDTAKLIEPAGFISYDCIDNIPQFRNCKWPRITTNNIREALRSVYSDYQSAQERADKAYKNIHQNFTYQIVVDKFVDLMEMTYNASSAFAQTV